MSDQLRPALVQLDPVVGDIAGNVARAIQSWEKARAQGADLVVFSELFLTGYPPEDFILKPRTWKLVREAVDVLARETASGPAILIGVPWRVDETLYNAALLLEGGQIIGQTFKHELPNYGPFDEKRLFSSGPLPMPMVWRGQKLGVMLCADMWEPAVSAHLKEQGAELFIVLNGSPYQPRKQKKRYRLASERAKATGLPILYVNQVGAQDELVFEGASFAMDSNGAIVVQMKSWSEDMFVTSCRKSDGIYVPAIGHSEPLLEGEAEIYQALMTAIRGYVHKNGFKKIALGLSGGVDSALVAALAVDALGAENVQTLMMPSPYTSPESITLAQDMAKILRCRIDTIRIDEAMKVFDTLLAEQFIGCPPDVTEENIQARIRGTLLMALSNKSGAMVLATGNKSELAVGYATLYGDMCGGYAPLKDVYKTQVYKLAHWRNKNMPVQALGPSGRLFPDEILTRAPSAELAPDQKDTDSLPPYEILDDILHCLLERNQGLAETVMMGHDSVVVRKVYGMLDRSEYKRRQGPPGPKVSSCHMGLDRRYPITNRFADRWQTQQMD